MIDEDFVVEFSEQLQPLIEKIEPSFFEITVAMAFEWFARQHVDVAIIETGLGGRLDSTNVIVPELSIITNIGFDHMNLLGNTLQQIAFEKAGIIKHRVPVVIGDTTPETKEVFIQKANEVDARLLLANEYYSIVGWQQEEHRLQVTVAPQHTDDRFTYSLDLTGLYQMKNLLPVLQAVHTLVQAGWNISHAQILAGLAEVRKLTGLHGRWEIIHQHPKVVLDVAHNTDGIKQVIAQLEHCVFQRLHIVIGMVKDKEIEEVLKLLPAYATYYFTRSQIPRALPESELAETAKKFHLQGHTFNTVQVAVQAAIDNAHTNDMILVCGSVFIVGEVNEHSLKW